MSVTNTSGLRSPATPEDVELFAHLEANLYTAVVADSLDELGYHNQAMNEHVRPLFPECRFAGWARTISCVDIFHVPENTYAKEIEAVDSLLVGYVAVDCAGVLVSPGDLIFADYDGVIVIPAEVVPDAIRLATEKVTRENHTREELLRGAYLRDVYEKYGVL